MKNKAIGILVSIAITAGAFLSGCGGGGGGGETGTSGGQPPPSTQTAVAWDPPTLYSDNTAMDAYRELDYYEFYLRQDRNFTESDVPAAEVKAVTDLIGSDGQTAVQNLTKEFALSNLLPFAQAGKVYYISIKAVGVGGLKSRFSAPVAWDLT
jgi:hypothetical protein